MAPRSCAAIRPLLSALIDGELNETERAAVERHLAACAECRRRLEEYRAIGRSIASLPRPEPPPALGRAVRRRLGEAAAEQKTEAAEGSEACHHPGAANQDACEQSRR